MSQQSRKKRKWMRSDDWVLAYKFVHVNSVSAEVTFNNYCKYILFQCDLYQMFCNLGLVATKPVFGVFDKASFKPASLAIATS